MLPPIDFFIAFYISFSFLIMALEIASSSIVANGACLKKKRQAGERIGIAINPKERFEWLPRRILFRDEVERKEFLVRAFLQVLFPRPKDKKLLPGYGKMIFNELKEHLLRFLARNDLREAFFVEKILFPSL